MVGDQHEVFGVHERLIRAYSPFFDKAMSGNWQESSRRAVELPDDEPTIFQLYIHWLYYETLPVFCNEPGLSGNAEYLELIKAYILGDKLMDSKFQDAVIDAIIEKSVSKASDGASWYPVGEALEYTYNNTNGSALIRKLLVDMYVIYGHGNWLHDWGEAASIPQPFLSELASRLLDLDRRDVVSRLKMKIEASNYHIHGSDGGEAKCD